MLASGGVRIPSIASQTFWGARTMVLQHLAGVLLDSFVCIVAPAPSLSMISVSHLSSLHNPRARSGAFLYLLATTMPVGPGEQPALYKRCLLRAAPDNDYM